MIQSCHDDDDDASVDQEPIHTDQDMPNVVNCNQTRLGMMQHPHDTLMVITKLLDGAAASLMAISEYLTHKCSNLKIIMRSACQKHETIRHQRAYSLPFIVHITMDAQASPPP